MWHIHIYNELESYSLLHVFPPQLPLHAHEKSVRPVRLQVPPLAHGDVSQGSFTARMEQK